MLSVCILNFSPNQNVSINKGALKLLAADTVMRVPSLLSRKCAAQIARLKKHTQTQKRDSVPIL